MAFDGINGNHQFVCNLLVGGTLSQLPKNLSFSFSQRILQRLDFCSLFYKYWPRFMPCTLLGKGGKDCVCRPRFMPCTLLGKGGKDCVHIGSWSILALPHPYPGEQCCHLRAFIHEAANVALRLG